jgi:hypothetical protein
VIILQTEEDYTEKSKKAVIPGFKLEECLNIADSQYNGMFFLMILIA